jgi:diguanylate cyclase (GGDEF)-like protein
MLSSQSNRQFVRMKTHHAAQARFADDTMVDCEIRDFCPTGLYLSFGDHDLEGTLGPSLIESTVEVGFVADARAPFRKHVIHGRVVHCAGGGIGVFATEMATETFQALLDHRTHIYRTAGEARRQELDPVDIRTIRLQCLSLYRPFLATVIREFFSLAMARGTEEYRAGATLANQSHILDALAELTRDQDGIQKRFISAALERVERQPSDTHGAQSEAQHWQDLSLLESEDFEDWLNLAGIINKLEAGLTSHLGQFESFYRLLSQRAGENDHGNALAQENLIQSAPFGPEALCRSFQEVVLDVSMDLHQRATIYQLFGQAIALHGPAFYATLAKIAAVVERRQNRAGPQFRGAADAQPVIPDAEASEMTAQPRFSADSTPQETTGYSLDRTLAAIHANASEPIASDSVGAPHAGAPTAAGSNGELGTITREGSLIRTTGLLQEVITELGQRVPAREVPFALTRADTRDHLPRANVEQLAPALDDLVRARLVKRPTAWDPSLSEQLRERLSNVGNAVVISEPHQQTLDALANLFDQVMTQYAPTSELEALMKRFEAPFFQLALNDPDFLVSDQHPARRILNVVDQFGVATDDNGRFFDPKLPRVVGVLVDHVFAKGKRKPELYSKTLGNLEKMLQPLMKERRQRIQRMQEASEGKHRILQSRIRVVNELEARLGGRQVPRLLLRLLDIGWRQYLNLVELRQGMQSEDWANGIGIVDRLFAWLAQGFEPGPNHAHEVADAMRQISRCMATVCTEPVKLESLIRQLNQTLLDRMTSGAMTAEHVRLEPRPSLRNSDHEYGAPPKDTRLQELLVMGSWWHMALEGDKPTPVQLIWLSQPPGNCAFANRSATRKHELSVAEFTRMREDGRAAPATDMDSPVLERSENSLIDAVYKHLSHQSSRDPVTNLINRKALIQKVERMTALPSNDGQVHTVGVIEFEKLRVISHLRGAEAQEALLRQLAVEIQDRLRPVDLLASIGSGSFAAYLPLCGALEAKGIFSQIIRWLSSYRFAHLGESFSISANIGIVQFRPGSLDAQEVLRRADVASMRAGSIGRNQIKLYTAEDAGVKDHENLLKWAGRIDEILNGNRLYLRCQQITPIHAESGLEPYYEILLGVRDHQGKNMGPQPFIQAAERWDRAHDVDRWVVERVFQWIRSHREAFDATGGFSINLSAQSLNNTELLAFLHRELAAADIPAAKINFEITETGTIESYGSAHEFMQQIRRYGCTFSIDDFGSGHASYGQLKNLHTDTLKIDGIFVKDMLSNPSDFAMVKSMKEIGHSLGMKVVAEYVATPEILAAVREIGVDYAQGYALHEPAPIESLIQAAEDAHKPQAMQL